jgi:predicted ATP-dependent protease
LKGLTGEQGVIIPANNMVNLMLNDEVIAAVEKGQFHIWPIQDVDEGLRLLTEIEPGELQEDGSYPQGTFNHVLMEHLEAFARAEKTKDEDQPEETNPPTTPSEEKEDRTPENSAPDPGG